MDLNGANKIERWLPNALPVDRDGDIYLNRYYMIYFFSDSILTESLLKMFTSLAVC